MSVFAGLLRIFISKTNSAVRSQSEIQCHKAPSHRSPRAPLSLLAAATLLLALAAAPAQMLVSIDTVAVGDRGNAADATGYGAVDHAYRIGKYEVTISQYTTFLNSAVVVASAAYIVDLWNSSCRNSDANSV